MCSSITTTSLQLLSNQHVCLHLWTVLLMDRTLPRRKAGCHVHCLVGSLFVVSSVLTSTHLFRCTGHPCDDLSSSRRTLQAVSYHITYPFRLFLLSVLIRPRSETQKERDKFLCIYYFRLIESTNYSSFWGEVHWFFKIGSPSLWLHLAQLCKSKSRLWSQTRFWHYDYRW